MREVPVEAFIHATKRRRSRRWSTRRRRKRCSLRTPI